MESRSRSESHAHQHGGEHDEESCPKCWAQLSTPLFCETCQELLEANESSTPFEALGLSPEYELNKMALRKRLLALSRRVHPDFHSNASPDVRERAERNTAHLNAAFEILSDDFHRADWLVRSLGGPSESEERQMPPAFLAQVLEWNETIEDAKGAEPGSPEAEALAELEATLRDEREGVMTEISQRLSPLPEAHAPLLAEVRRNLNVIRYLDRALREIDELRIAPSSGRGPR